MKLFEIARRKPRFVLVMGGAGSGKNYYIEHNHILKQFTCVDVDELKKRMPLDTAIKKVKVDLEELFTKGIDVVHPTTGSNMKGQQNKIALAKKYGYETEIILKDTPLDQALLNVISRAKSGGHSVLEKDIVASNEKARANYNELSELVDKSRVV
jgi:predicted kinase